MQWLFAKESYYRPFIPLLFSFITGITTGAVLPDRDGWCLFFVIVAAIIVVYNVCRDKPAFISPLVLFAGLGYLSIQIWVSPNFPSHHVIQYADRIPRRITGNVVHVPAVNKSRRTSFYMNVETLSCAGKPFAVTGKIRVTLMGESLFISPGDGITFIGRIRPIRNFYNPGRFDYERFMAFEQIWVTAFAHESQVQITPAPDKNAFRATLASIRNDIAGSIEKSAGKQSAGVLKALTLGDKTQMPTEVRGAFNRLGLGHLLAISGLHIGIVASISFFLLHKIGSFAPLLLRHGLVQKTAAVISLGPVMWYGMMSGMSPSTQRAVIMVAVFMFAFWFDRESNPLNALAVAALLILMINPTTLFSVSFQLSFAAVTAILLGLSLLSKRLIRNGSLIQKLRTRFIFFLGVSAFATIGTLPIVMHYFNLISFIGLPANCIAVPLIGFFVVPVALFSTFVFPFSPFLAELGFRLASAALEPAIRLFLMLSDFRFVAVDTITPNMLEIGCFYLILLGLLFFRRSRTAKLALAVAVLVLAVDVSYWVNRRWFSDDFRVTALDVGQGTAILLELPDGYTMMIDGGGFSDNSNFDVGKNIIAPYLLRNKIRTVNTLVLSHPDADHLNGLIHIADSFHVQSVWTNGQKADSNGYKHFTAVIEEHHITAPAFASIPRRQVINDVLFSVLHPPCDFDPFRFGPGCSRNDNSIVLSASYGSTRFLFTGDITQTAERKLSADKNVRLSADVLFAPHHGSRSSSSASFLDRVNPDYVVFCVGWQNRFGFPHSSIITRYRKRHCRIFRTDMHGAVRMITDGNRLSIKTTLKSVTIQPI
ncbi:MAG: DNA internalization-related competence protein ComEC/Rec2 [Desulfobacterales bacterium]